MMVNRINGELCFDKCFKQFYGEKYETYVVYYEGEIEKSMEKYDYACLLYISANGIAGVIVQKGRIRELVDDSKEIIRIVKENIYTLSEFSKSEYLNTPQINTMTSLELQGKGVIVAIIDTGIDYLNKEFQYENNTTRIISIWDQTIDSGKSPENVYYGSEYERDQINNAIMLAEEKGDPKTIVPSVDVIGHGTAMAGIIGANGNNKALKSTARECEFIVVKLREANNYTINSWAVERKDRHIYSGSDIITAIEYIIAKIKKLFKPVVIFIPLGSNCGSHDGNDVLDALIDKYSLNKGIVFVTDLGSEGKAETHTSGQFTNKYEIKTIKLQIDKNQKDVFVQIWLRKPDKASIEIISPSGETSRIILSKIESSEYVYFVLAGTSGIVSHELAVLYSGDQLIDIELRKVVSGVWLLQLHGDYIVDGRFDGWLMQRVLLEKETKFLNPDPMITLTAPSDSINIISCSYYNQNDNSIIDESGKGYTRDERVKPDLSSPGVNVVTTEASGGIISVTGSSVGSANLVASAAVLLQWGIVQGKVHNMSAITVKNYLIKGTKKRDGDIYPNPVLGYGLLDMDNVLKEIKEDFRCKRWIFVNIPNEIRYLLNGK